MSNPSLILASGSPRRKQILTDAGIPFTVLASNADETVPEDTAPKDKVLILSKRKAQASLALTDGKSVVLAADTVVAMDNLILEKPHTPEKATEMLRMLSGRSHQVITGITITDGKTTVSDVVVSNVTMRELSDAEIARYVATGAPLDKAGAYGIQEHAGLFVESIEGDYFNIVGLPLYRTGQILKETFHFEL